MTSRLGTGKTANLFLQCTGFLVARILTANPKKRRLTRTRMPRDRNTCDSVGSGVVVRTLVVAVVVVVASVVFNVERSVVAVVLSVVVSTVDVVVDVVVLNAVVTAATAARPIVLTTCSKGTRGGIAAILNRCSTVPVYTKYTLSRRSGGFDVFLAVNLNKI